LVLIRVFRALFVVLKKPLQGLPLPKQCKNCKSGKCNKPGPKKQAPPQDSRGAGKTQGPDQSGS
jgi:hypothetical protein